MLGFGTLALLAMSATTMSPTHDGFALPDNRTISYTIYLDPDHPENGIDYVVELELEAVDSVGDNVAWEVTEARLTKKGGAQDVVWRETQPWVNTGDGLWWINHADGERPVLKEFLVPPSIEGTATPDDPTEEDLGYDLVGDVYVLPPGTPTPPFAMTASLTYTFWKSGDPDPDSEGDDLPTEAESDPLD